MKSTRHFPALLTAIALLHGASALAADAIDMDDPRRVVGRENDVRVDAQLLHDTVSPGTAVGLVYQVQNFSAHPIAIAGNTATASYDRDSATITLSVGAEIPPEGRMPLMEIIGPGEKKVLSVGATPKLTVEAANPRFGGAPRYVQVKVSFLRDVHAFATLISRQDARGGAQFPDELFDRWFEAQATVFLNSVPVRFSPRARGADASVGARIDSGRGM